MTFALKIDVDALAFIRQLPGKSQEIIDGKIKTLKDDPFPGKRGEIGTGVHIHRGIGSLMPVHSKECSLT